VLSLFIFFFGCASGNQLLQIEKKAKAKEDMGLALRATNPRLALVHLLEAEKLAPHDPDIQYELALVYQDLGEYQSALPHYKKALALKPDFPIAMNNLGGLYLMLKDWDNAIAIFEKLTKSITYKTPQYAYNHLGVAYFNKKHYDKAIAMYQRALRIDPNYSSCYINLALTYEAQQRWADAMGAYQSAIDLAPEDPTPHFLLGRRYFLSGNKTKALEALYKCIELDPRGPFVEGAKKMIRELQ
jgi:tetratricopeptide (TPR) repeat protein